MCDSKANGGPCASKANKLWAGAQKKLDETVTKEIAARESAGSDKTARGLGQAIMRADMARKREHDAAVTYAMTPQGKEEFETQQRTDPKSRASKILDEAADRQLFNNQTFTEDRGDLYRYVVRVHSTKSRPVKPDEITSTVTVMAESDNDAIQLAALMSMRPASPQIGLNTAIQMPTRTTIIEVEL